MSKDCACERLNSRQQGHIQIEGKFPVQLRELISEKTLELTGTPEIQLEPQHVALIEATPGKWSR